MNIPVFLISNSTLPLKRQGAHGVWFYIRKSRNQEGTAVSWNRVVDCRRSATTQTPPTCAAQAYSDYPVTFLTHTLGQSWSWNAGIMEEWKTVRRPPLSISLRSHPQGEHARVALHPCTGDARRIICVCLRRWQRQGILALHLRGPSPPRRQTIILSPSNLPHTTPPLLDGSRRYHALPQQLNTIFTPENWPYSRFCPLFLGM